MCSNDRVSTRDKILADLEAEALRLSSSSEEVSEWAERCSSSLRRLFGENSRELAEFSRVGYEGPVSLHGYDVDEGRTREEGLRRAKALLGAWRQVELTFPGGGGGEHATIVAHLGVSKGASPELERFLEGHAGILGLCNSVDVAGVAVEKKGRLEVVCVRITAGASLNTIVNSLTPFGPWRVFHYRFDATHLSRVAHALTETGCLRLDDETEIICELPPRNLYENSFVQSPDGVFDRGPVQIAWLGAPCGDKAFLDQAEHSRFFRLIGASDDYHDVSELVKKLPFRQSLTIDEQRGVRFEIESPIYFRESEWRNDRVVLNFSIPLGIDLSGMRVKWQTANARGIAPIARESNSQCVATIVTEESQLSAAVICESTSLWSLVERRPQEPISFLPELETEDDTERRLPDYSKFETTRRGLRLLIKKQVYRDEVLYKIISRDIEDAILCLERGSYKLAAILSGAIIEATLLGRLSGELQADVEAAFRAAFPSQTTNAIPRLEKLTLAQLIAVAEKRGRLKDHKIYDAVRDWRNFIHPNLEANKGSIDVTAAQIAVTAAVRLLLGKS